MSVQPVRVLVLYSHALMGEGLGRMLASEPGVTVATVDGALPEAVTAALAAEPSVIVVEEGGAIDAAEIMRRSSCPLVLDVDITTTRAWMVRREIMCSGPDDFLAAIRQVVGSAPSEPAAPDAAADRDRALHPVHVPG